MKNYPRSSRESIRDTTSRLPPSHPSWRLDKDLGLRSWAGGCETKTQLRQPPVLPFEVWLDESATPQPFQCTECVNAGGTFATPGILGTSLPRTAQRRLDDGSRPASRSVRLSGNTAFRALSLAATSAMLGKGTSPRTSRVRTAKRQSGFPAGTMAVTSPMMPKGTASRPFL